MPFENVQVPAEILLEYKGITVYHTYKYNNINDPSMYGYALDDDDSDEGDMFDVRDLPNWGGNAVGRADVRAWSIAAIHKDVVREAIDHGYLDKEIEAAGLQLPVLSEWPLTINEVGELHYWQLKRLVNSYDRYIQKANDDDKYEHAWKPVCINEFYGAEFREELTESYKEQYKIGK